MEIIERAYDVLLIGSMLILAVLIICGIIRSVLGPKIADRIIAVNMIGTLTIILIAILSVYLGENYRLSDLRHDQFPGGGGAVQGLHGRISAEKGNPRGQSGHRRQSGEPEGRGDTGAGA